MSGTAEKSNKIKAPTLADDDADMPIAKTVDQALVSAMEASELAAAGGFTIKHVSGSFPLIAFEEARDKGKTILVRWLGLEPAGDNEWDMVQLEVYSLRAYFTSGGDLKKSFVGNAQLHVADNLKRWAGNLDHPERKDKNGNVRPAETARKGTADENKVYAIQYNGTVKTASNRKVHKFAVGEVQAPAKKN